MVRASIRPSPLLATVLTLLHAAAAATVFPQEVAPGWKAALIAATLAGLAHSLFTHALRRSPHAIVELEITDKEHAAVRTNAGSWTDARILASSCVTPTLTTINLKVDGLRVLRHVVLVRDNVDADDFRNIRVLLRWARADRAGAAETGDAPG